MYWFSATKPTAPGRNELRESQEQFRSIVSAAQDAIIMIDPQGRISSWNRSAERVFGYSAGEVVGQNLHRLLVPARFHESHEKGFAEFLRSGEGVAVGEVLELPALHKEGREFLVDCLLPRFAYTISGTRLELSVTSRSASGRRKSPNWTKPVPALFLN